MEAATFSPSVASTLFQPLADVWAIIDVKTGKRKVQGHHVAFVVLAFITLESWIGRRAKTADEDLDALLKRLGATTALRDDIQEFLVLRNSISHGHLFEEVLSWRTLGPVRSRRVKRIRGREDQRFERFVNKKTMRTKRQKLHADPTKVDDSDSRKAATILLRTLTFMSRRNLPHPGQSGMTVWFPNLSAQRGEAAQLTVQEFLRLVSASSTRPAKR